MKKVFFRKFLMLLVFAVGVSYQSEVNAAGYTPDEQKSEVYSIKGHIKGIPSGTVTLSYRRNDHNSGKRVKEQFTAEVKDGYFEFNGGSLGAPVYCSIDNDKYLVQIQFWLENAPVTIEGSIESDVYDIKGSKTQEEDGYFHKYYDKYSEEMMKATAEFNDARKRKESEEVIGRLEGEMKYWTRQRADFGEQFVKEHSNSRVSLIYMFNCTYAGNEDYAERVLGFLSPDLRNSSDGQRLWDRLTGIKSTKPGLVLPEYHLPDSRREIVKTADFPGKYLILSFVLGDGKSFRDDVEIRKRVLKKYQDKGVGIMDAVLEAKDSVALYKLEKQLEIPWHLLSDFRGFENDATWRFNISRFPTILLVDPNGILIERYFSMASVEAKLDELFKN